ncbi:MAG: ABC transporter ATP-binding protein/permease [Rhodoferax sp.]
MEKTKPATRWQTLRQFSRDAWTLTIPYFNSDQRWRARGLLAAIVLLNLALVYLAVLFNEWNRLFYDALQAKDAEAFWHQLARFGTLAAVYILIAVYKFYLTQWLELRWRAWMTQHYVQRWLDDRVFYRLELSRFAPPREGVNPDNPDQRIQEDINQFTAYTISLSMGLLNALVTLGSFVGILWQLSGDLGFGVAGVRFDIPGFMVWMALLYSLAGSVITHFIGRPQIALNFTQQRLEAEFRHHLIRVREASESIALDGGAPVEGQQLRKRFDRVLDNALALIRAQKRLVWFTSFFGQAAVVFPFLVAAPRFFSGAIQLGELMQISSAFGQVQGALSWFVDNYTSLAAWRATTERLTGFEAAVQSLQQQRSALQVQSNADELRGEDLKLELPDGRTLLQGVSLHTQPGQSVLIRGASGSGKSSLLRLIAGVWPYASGTLQRPRDVMFLPQRPYFPEGRLRDALAYPHEAQTYDDATLRQALIDAELPALADRLDEVAAWGQCLSGGEQQRLALARVFLRQPQWLFADEATSALDEASEQRLCQTLLARMRPRRATLISVGHRPGLVALHEQHWRLADGRLHTG